MGVELKSVSFNYGKRVILKDVSITIENSSINAIIGPNGIGKTTLLKLIAGLLKPQNGEIFCNSLNLNKIDYLRRAKIISYLSQFPLYNKEESLFELVKKGDYPHKRLPPPPRSFEKRKEIAEEFLNLKELWHRKINTLSGGEIQRGVVGRLIIQDTPIMILDEPTNHLDLFYKLKLFQLFNKLKSEGKTIIYAIHDFNISLQFKHNIFVLGKGGEVIKCSNKDELKENLCEVYQVNFEVLEVSDFAFFYPNKKERS